MRKLLTEQDFVRAASKLDCNVAAIKAVDEVESRGAGFLVDGRPKILFERHVFHRELIKRGVDTRRHERENPGLVNARAGGYVGGASEWRRLDEAVDINRDAALSACSWGRYQIMGFNWKAAGAESIQDFVNRMYRSEGEHLDAFCEFVIAENMLPELQAHDWPRFAAKYNGPAYAKNRYDVKLAAAYAKHSGVR